MLSGSDNIVEQTPHQYGMPDGHTKAGVVWRAHPDRGLAHAFLIGKRVSVCGNVGPQTVGKVVTPPPVAGKERQKCMHCLKFCDSSTNTRRRKDHVELR